VACVGDKTGCHVSIEVCDSGTVVWLDMVKVLVHLQLWFDIVIHYGSCGVKSDILTIETQLET